MTLNDCSTTLYGQAVEYEEDGALAEAAERYALSAFADALGDDFRPGRPMRISFALTLAAISADVRAGDDVRPKNLFEVLEPLYEKMIDETDDPVLEGLLNEWFGDAWLMLGRSEALPRYRTAKQRYDDHAKPVPNWAFEEEFDYAYWAFEAFVEANDTSLPDDGETDFLGRIHFKRNLVSELSIDQ